MHTSGEIDVQVRYHDFDGKSRKRDQGHFGLIFEHQRNRFGIKTGKCWKRMDDSYLSSQYGSEDRTFFSETLYSH